MKKITTTVLVFITVISGILIGCQKKDSTTPATTTTQTAKPNDQQGSTEADGAISDVNDFINNKVGGGSTMRINAYALPCGVVSIDSSTTNSYGKKVYTMQYGNQTPCGYKKKSGQVAFALSNGTGFNTVGAVFTITFTNYMVQSEADGSTVTLNGSIVITNTTGYYIWEAVTSSKTIIHKLRGSFNVTYSDNTIRSRSYYQKRTWTSSNSWAGLTLKVAGDTLISSVSAADSISEIGKTYAGNYDYQTMIINDFTWSNCGTTYTGPYVLKSAKARLNVTIPNFSPTYVDVEGGYYWNYSSGSTTPTLVGDCTTNAYMITTVIGTTTTTVYQLY
ncbi:MAG TPA: hypothetical protein VK766_07635 [Cytophagaceae bacterium]|jgi:hypothetical protein|nr:hypothetical protein [Cytophagaceae bacterium]